MRVGVAGERSCCLAWSGLLCMLVTQSLDWLDLLLCVCVAGCGGAVRAQAQVECLQAGLSDAERRVYEGELLRRKLHNIIQVSTGQSPTRH